MEVLNTMIKAFSHRILDEYTISRGYIKMNERQKICSVLVLKFLLSNGVERVRRLEIRDKFMGRREDWKRPAFFFNGKWERPALPMKDNELQSILERLILGGFVKKNSVCPSSKRTRDRKKPDVYYSISYLLLQDVDWLGGELLDAYRKSKSSNICLARSELRRLHITNTNDEDLDDWLIKDAKDAISTLMIHGKASSP